MFKFRAVNFYLYAAQTALRFISRQLSSLRERREAQVERNKAQIERLQRESLGLDRDAVSAQLLANSVDTGLASFSKTL